MSESKRMGRQPAETYKIKRATMQRGYHSYSVTIPASIAEPLFDAGLRVRFDVTENGILMMLVPAHKPDGFVSEERRAAEALVARINDGKGV